MKDIKDIAEILNLSEDEVNILSIDRTGDGSVNIFVPVTGAKV